MRIGFFVDRWHLTDGITIALGLLRKELEAMGHEAYIFSPGERKRKEENKDPKVFFFTAPVFKDYPDFNLMTFPNNSAHELAKKLEIDIIHSFAMGTMGVAASNLAGKMNAPSVLTAYSLPHRQIDSMFSNGIGSLVHKLSSRYMKWYLSSFKCLCVPSQYVSGSMEKELGIKAHNVLSLGIDYEAASKGAAAEKKKGKLIYAGKIASEKDLDIIISSMPSISNRIPEADVFIYGEGPYREVLIEKSISAKIDDHVFIGSFLGKRRLFSEFSDSSLFLFPSQADTQSLSLIEAMAAGVIPVCPQDSCAYELIKGTPNERFAFNARQDFSEKVLQACSEASGADRAAASKAAAAYDIKEIAKRHVALYESLKKKRIIP
jgi:1,2-diacylglycerol 3-alpha-glucosyltransferase